MKQLLTICLFLLLTPSYLSANEANEKDKSSTIRLMEATGGCTPVGTNSASFPFPQVYLPSASNTSIPIRINLIFVQKNDGTCNFQEDDIDHQLYLDESIEQLNNIYANLQQTTDTDYCYVGDSFISNAKIRFEDHRYYIRDTYGWNNNITNDPLHGFGCGGNWYLLYLDNEIINCDTIPRGINVYFTEDSTLFHMYMYDDTVNFKGDGRACALFPMYTNYNYSSRVHMPNTYSLYWTKVFLSHPDATESEHAALRTQYAGWLARGLAHELGHSLDLQHNNLEDNTIDAYKYCAHSIMRGSSGQRRNFLSPFKIGIAHYALMGSNLQRFVPTDCFAGTKQISQDISFPKSRFYHSLLLNNQCHVTFGCEAIMSPNASITVSDGSVLTIEDAKLVSAQDSWKGIIVNANSTLVLSNVHIDGYDITVNSGGKIIILDSLTIDGDNYIKVNDGACICIADDAIINLVDTFSIIDIQPNALIGCTPPLNVNCLSSLSGLPHFGHGSIVLYTSDAYIQNEIISTSYLSSGTNVKAGYNVTSTKPVGPVRVTSRGHLRILSPGEVLLGTDFEVQLGGELEIKEH